MKIEQREVVKSEVRLFLSLVAVILTSTGLLCPYVYGQGIIVRPMLIETSLAPGEAHTELIEIQNFTEEDLVVQITEIDFSISEDGDLQFSEAGSSPFSLHDWIAISTNELLVKAGETETIQVYISAPKEASQLCRWGGLLIESVTPPAIGTMSIKMRFAVLLLQTNPMVLPRSGKVETMKVEVHEPEEGSGLKEGNSRTVAIFSTFSNMCLNILEVDIRFEVRDMTGDTVAYQEIHDRVVLPESKRIFTAKFPADDWPPGQYLALAIVDYGGETLTGGQWPFGIPGE